MPQQEWKPLQHGLDSYIPEVNPYAEPEPFSTKARSTLQSVLNAYLDQGQPQLSPEAPDVQWPSPPSYEDLPSGVPKSTLKKVLLVAAGGIPGFNQGYWGSVGERRAEVAGRNKRAFDIFQQEIERAKAQTAEGGRKERAEAQNAIKLLTEQRQRDKNEADAQIKWANTEIARMRATAAQQRADAYSQNIQDLITNVRPQQAALALDQLKARIDSDESLDEYRRSALAQTYSIARMSLAQRAKEEEGRMARLKVAQDAISQRQQYLISKGLAPNQIMALISESVRIAQTTRPDYSPENADDLEFVNTILDSVIQNKYPQFAPGEKRGGFLGFGGSTPADISGSKPVPLPPAPLVTPKVPNAAPQPTAPDQNAPPAHLLKVGVNTKFDNGQVWTLDPTTRQPKRVS